MRLIVLLLAVIWYDSPSLGRAHSSDLRHNLHNHHPRSGFSQSKRSSRITKRQDDLGYLEQCSILQFWDKQIGRVNVLAFFDSSWQFSHRQAAMLRVLRERFERTGFKNIQFFAINSAPDEAQFIDPVEVEIEEETWRKISPNEAGGLPPVLVSTEGLIEALGPDVYFIQDTDQLQIWSKLRAYRDQILVIDRCGRLTYQVIVPWSILHFPYVKAAILSTYNDEPCGRCQFQESPFEEKTTDFNVKSATSEESPTVKTENDIDDSSSTSSEQVTDQTLSYNDALPEESTTFITESEKREDALFSSENSTATDKLRTEGSTIFDTSESPVTLPSETSAEYSSGTEPEPSYLMLTDSTEETAVNATSAEDESTTSPNYPSEGSDSTFTEDTPTTLDDQTEDFEGATSSDEAMDDLFDQTENSTTDGVTSSTLDASTIIDLVDDDILNATNNNGSQYFDTADFNSTSTVVPDSETTTTGYTENFIEDVTESTRNNTTEQATAAGVSTLSDSTNSSGTTNQTSLKNDQSIESIDSRDVLKSRLTNARSVSAKDGTINHLENEDINSETNEDETSKEPDFDVPIRIIMRAPHVDEYSDQSMKAHEYLVLKTGQPDYHEHLDSRENDSHGNLSHISDDQLQPNAESSLNKSDTVKRTFGKDESPGLYGEVADYWRNFGRDQDDGFITNTDDQYDDEQGAEQGEAISEDTVSRTTAQSLNDKMDNENNSEEPKIIISEEDDEKIYDYNVDTNDEVDLVDEEAKSKLIAHYSKLLPWLYYVLAK